MSNLPNHVTSSSQWALQSLKFSWRYVAHRRTFDFLSNLSHAPFMRTKCIFNINLFLICTLTAWILIARRNHLWLFDNKQIISRIRYTSCSVSHKKKILLIMFSHSSSFVFSIIYMIIRGKSDLFYWRTVNATDKNYNLLRKETIYRFF